MKQSAVVVVGSLNMDLVVSTDRMPLIGETIQGTEIHYIPGGKGANQAVGCARLGANTIMIGAVGNDLFGGQIIEQLQGYGLQTNRIDKLDGVATGTATILHTKQDNCIVIVPGANGQMTEERVNANKEEFGHAAVVLLQLEIPLDAVMQALKLAKAAGAMTVLNPAPALAEPLPKELLQLVDVLTPNETEFAALSGHAVNVSEAEMRSHLMNWEQKHGNRVLVTRGSAGCSYLDEERQLITVPSLKVKVTDTTGAGDCLNAALCCSIAAGRSFAESIQFAVAASSLSVTKFGAQAGMPTEQDVLKAMQ
ncbi:ribokinase [Paenibacillus baekrokdamisoli]|uniref:Ribokinase n=1 Tax=Paenibacillus baekrokdamisoli TaxID=1712516 RepID=A0A3G9JGA8_9BACL|nr:ribokinase [Paenibacillus baekrokdamisoli]MBB3070878.1 ribokinase [Paenibacillus baekrokdamisoli]BBH22184.1 ribokinase [Paenibacillus baekrokdamisoli]